MKLSGSTSNTVIVEAVIDTGFTGFLTLPSSLIASLGMPFLNRQQVILGDGNRHSLNVHSGYVEWNGLSRRIEIDAAETTPLVGMSLMYGYKLTVEDVDGGNVTIELLK